MADTLRLTSFDPDKGKFTYTGSVRLDDERRLTFYVDGGFKRITNLGAESGPMWLQPRFDEYDAADLEQGLHRLALWMESAARSLRGRHETGLPLLVEYKPEVNP